jgi:Fe-Mn family superoxide dismutase
VEILSLKTGFSEVRSGYQKYGELKRRLGWEFNGMRLHELHFENLGGKEILNKVGKLRKKLVEELRKYENWEADFKGVGTMRGIRWGILYQDSVSGKLINHWINEHDVGHPAGCNPLLILDIFEHAFCRG